MTGLKGQDKRMSINIFRNLMVWQKAVDHVVES
jgi:hypothetical protein